MKNNIFFINIIITVLLTIILGLIIIFARKNNVTSISKTEFALDTVVTVTIYVSQVLGL